jgi:hypothetical protein
VRGRGGGGKRVRGCKRTRMERERESDRKQNRKRHVRSKRRFRNDLAEMKRRRKNYDLFGTSYEKVRNNCDRLETISKEGAKGVLVVGRGRGREKGEREGLREDIEQRVK